MAIEKKPVEQLHTFTDTYLLGLLKQCDDLLKAYHPKTGDKLDEGVGKRQKKRRSDKSKKGE